MSDETTSDSPVGGELDRRELLKRAGVVGAGAVAAGALGGTAKAATKRHRATPIKKGGRLVWGLESDPAHVAPFGGILTANHWAKEFAYDSLVEWDRNLNVRPALAEKFEILSKTAIRWTLKRGIKFHNGKELTSADVKYSVERMLNPPLPGSISTVAQVPAIDRVQVVSKYVFILHLKQSDARIIGFFAWQRYAPIVPEGLYDQINVSRNAIGTGPYRMLGYEPNDRIEYVKNPNFWKKGFPYMNSMQLKILADEQARVAALKAGAIDGATLSVDVARSLANDSNLRVLKGPNAGFRELQMTIKRGEDKPWHKQGVRLAVMHGINRADIIRRVYSGEAEYSGHVPPGYGPWPLSDKELKEKYEKFDLPLAKKLMADAGYANGFKVTMTTFAQQDYPLISAVVQSQLKQLKIDVEIVAQEAGTFAANNGRGTFDWDLTGRGMRGDVDGYVAEFHPAAPVFNIWYPEYRAVKAWRGIGNGRIQLDPAKRIPIYKAAQRELMLNPVQIPLVAIKKYQVVRKRVQNMYVAFSDFNTGLRNVWLNG
ncbi:MAG TPA: ABC transporter substrate-binding protein [Gaiellaceae bacterium]|nr:ABC transporter substrate-binding protein [Gaiellaceae bacterium]